MGKGLRPIPPLVYFCAHSPFHLATLRRWPATIFSIFGVPSMMNIVWWTLSAALLLSSVSAFCGHDHVMEEYLRQGNHSARYHDMRRAIHSEIQSRGLFKRSEELRIAVVWHVLYDPAVPASRVSRGLIEREMVALNDWFHARNAFYTDGDIWRNQVASASDLNIRFELAALRPDGTPTDGIEWVESPLGSGCSTGSTDMFYAAQGGADNWDARYYYNVYTCDILGTTTGFAYYPDGTSALDNCVLDYTVVGSDSTLGGTLAHETGHWLGLPHTFAGHACVEEKPSADDNLQLNDTPDTDISGTSYLSANQGGPGPDCCEAGYDMASVQRCGHPVMYTNIMDYGFLPCQRYFTRGQAQEMRGYLLSSTSRRRFLPTSHALPAQCTSFDCYQKQCGSDGCGGTCGACGAYSYCNEAQQCISTIPTNTDCPHALEFPQSTRGYTFDQNTLGTRQGGTLGSCYSEVRQGPHLLWYRFVAEADGSVELSSTASALPSVMSAYQGTGDCSGQLYCAGGAVGDTLQFTVRAGRLYFVVLDSANKALGDLSITMRVVGDGFDCEPNCPSTIPSPSRTPSSSPSRGVSSTPTSTPSRTSTSTSTRTASRSPAPSPPCVPQQACEALGYECGLATTQCGPHTDCGSCSQGKTCSVDYQCTCPLQTTPNDAGECVSLYTSDWTQLLPAGGDDFLIDEEGTLRSTHPEALVLISWPSSGAIMDEYSSVESFFLQGSTGTVGIYWRQDQGAGRALDRVGWELALEGAQATFRLCAYYWDGASVGCTSPARRDFPSAQGLEVQQAMTRDDENGRLYSYIFWALGSVTHYRYGYVAAGNWPQVGALSLGLQGTGVRVSDVKLVTYSAMQVTLSDCISEEEFQRMFYTLSLADPSTTSWDIVERASDDEINCKALGHAKALLSGFTVSIAAVGTSASLVAQSFLANAATSGGVISSVAIIPGTAGAVAAGMPALPAGASGFAGVVPGAAGAGAGAGGGAASGLSGGAIAGIVIGSVAGGILLLGISGLVVGAVVVGAVALVNKNSPPSESSGPTSSEARPRRGVRQTIIGMLGGVDVMNDPGKGHQSISGRSPAMA